MAEPLFIQAPPVEVTPGGEAPALTPGGSAANRGGSFSFMSEAGAAEPDTSSAGVAKDMAAAGFSETEVADWKRKHAAEMRAAGFSQAEVDKDMGVKAPLDMSGVRKFVAGNLKAAADEEQAALDEQKAIKAKPEGWYNQLVDSATKGWGASITGMLQNKKLPESMPEDAAWAEKLTYSAASLAGDVPYMIGGAMAGGVAGSAAPVVGNVVGGGVGAFMVPAMIRKTLVDNLKGDKYYNAADFAQQAMAILYDGIKQGSVGGLTALTGGAVGAATKAAGPLVSGGAQTAAEIATMTTAGKALESQLPGIDDFTIGTALVGIMHGSVALGKMSPRTAQSVQSTMMDVYAKTGIKPRDLVEMAKNDPTIAQDIILGKDVPDALKDHVDPTLRAETIPKLPTAPEVALGKEPPVPPGETPPEGVARDPWEEVSKHIDFKGQDAKEPVTWDKIYTRYVNDMHPLFVDQKAMLKDLGKDLRDLPADQQPHLLALNSRGTFGRAAQQLENHTYEFNSYKDNGEGLKQILAPVKDDIKGWATYALSKRTLELAARGIDGGIPLADAQEVVRTGAAKYGDINNDIVAYQNRVSKQLRDSGIISPEMYDKMLDLNKNYTPFFRVMDGGASGIGGGLNTSNPIHGIKGSERQIINPLESIIKNTYVYTALAERNAIGKAYLKLAESTGHAGDWLEKVNPGVKGTTVANKEMAKFLADHGIEGVPDDLLTVFRTLREPLENNQIAIFKEGVRTVYALKNQETANAFKGLDQQSATLVEKVLSVPAASLRAGATTLSPDFIVTNPLRDQITAFVYGNNIPVLDFVSGMFSVARKDEAFQNWRKGGGANAAMVSIDRDYLRERLKSMNLESLDGQTGLMSRAWNVAKTPLHVLQIMNELAENLTRVGVYKRNSEGGLFGIGATPQGELSKADILAGASAAREGTLDFAKKGSQMRALNMITDFSSAGINGNDKMVRMMKDNPAGFAAKVFVGITLPSILLYEAQKDDPRWTDGSIPDWQKDLFYIVLTKDHIYRIRKDFQLGVIFGSGAEHILKAYDDYNKSQSLDTQSLSHYFGTVWGATLPPVVPTGVTPLLEQATNHSFFNNQPLIPASKEKLLPEYQYNDYTTELTKKLGSIVGSFPGMRSDLNPNWAKNLASPIVMDNYVRQWTGGLGVYAVQLLDAALRKTGVLNDPGKPESTLADIPVVRAFVMRYPSAQAQGVQDFYDRESRNAGTYATIQALYRAGDMVGLQKELGLGANELVDGAKLNPALATMARLPGIKMSLDNMTKAVHLINTNPTFSPSDKRQLIDSIYFQMILVAHGGNDAFRQIDDLLGRSLFKPPPAAPEQPGWPTNRAPNEWSWLFNGGHVRPDPEPERWPNGKPKNEWSWLFNAPNVADSATK